MKKTILPVLLVSLFVLPFMSNNALATVGELLDYDTGIKADAPSDTVVLSWEIEACQWAADNADIEVTYRHTSPPKARNGEGFYMPDPPIIDTTVTGGIWYGSITFDSEISSSAKRGVNHGDITISWPSGPTFTWSFNVQHSNK